MITELPVLYPDSAPCTCKECVGMCERMPCWPTPADAERLIAAGYGDRLMPEYWVSERALAHYAGEANIYVLSPATTKYLVTREVDEDDPLGTCCFLKEGRCELHHAGLKPYEGRVAICGENTSPANLHRNAASAWNNPEAQSLVERWRAMQPTSVPA